MCPTKETLGRSQRLQKRITLVQPTLHRIRIFSTLFDYVLFLEKAGTEATTNHVISIRAHILIHMEYRGCHMQGHESTDFYFLFVLR